MTKKQQPTANNPVLNEADEQAFNSRLQECPIAIVGMASIFADAKNLEDYWDNIFESEGASCNSRPDSRDRPDLFKMLHF